MVKATTHLLSIKLPATEIDPNSVKPGWVALLIVLALGAATVLLWRNMGKQLKKIDFDPDAHKNPPRRTQPTDVENHKRIFSDQPRRLFAVN